MCVCVCVCVCVFVLKEEHMSIGGKQVASRTLDIRGKVMHLKLMQVEDATHGIPGFM